MRFIIVFISFVFFNRNSTGQNYIDIASFHYSTTPKNNFDTSLSNSSIVTELGLDITLPIKLNDSNAIITGLFLDKIAVKFDPFNDYTSISTINLKLGFNKKLSKTWSVTSVFLPKTSSDFRKISFKSFQYGGVALFKYTKFKNLNYTIGLYYNGELFGPFFVPLLGIYYKSPNNKFEVNMLLPASGNINHKLYPWVSLGLSFSTMVKSYDLNKGANYLVKKSNDVFGYLQFKINQRFLLQTKSGYSVGRSYYNYDIKDKIDFGVSAFRFGDNRKELNPSFKDGVIFKVKLIYRFYLK